jgi:hypothetical protein
VSGVRGQRSEVKRLRNLEIVDLPHKSERRAFEPLNPGTMRFRKRLSNEK